jgi:GH15 family glucan-1,4-alpha-glucosidase
VSASRKTKHVANGRPGSEHSDWASSPSSFWLVSPLAIVGEAQRAQDMMERPLRIAPPLGLYAEEFDAATGRHLGNYPQAFSHLTLIEAAARITSAERLKEVT